MIDNQIFFLQHFHFSFLSQRLFQRQPVFSPEQPVFGEDGAVLRQQPLSDLGRLPGLE